MKHIVVVLTLLIAGNGMAFVSCGREQLNPDLNNLVQYGISKMIFYKEVPPGDSSLVTSGKELSLNVLSYQNGMHENTYSVTVEGTSGLNFEINEDKGFYQYAGLVSDDDVKLAGKSLTSKKAFVKVETINEESFVGLFNKDTTAVNNLKKQLPIFLERGSKTKQSFYIFPFGKVDSEVRVYWQDKNELIYIYRNYQDWDLNKINFAQTKIDKSVVASSMDNIKKYSVEVMVP